MNRYLILDNNNNRMFKPELIGMEFNGIECNEYIQIMYDGNTIYFLKADLQQIPQLTETAKEEITVKSRPKNIRKTAVINSIKAVYGDDRRDSDIKEVLRIKRALKSRTIDNIESITYLYNKLLSYYYMSNYGDINTKIHKMLKDTVKEIYYSDIEIANYLHKEMIENHINWKLI